MHANDMTFGIELEITLPITAPITVGAYHVGHQIAGLPAGWTAQRDGSIRAGRGRIACEVVSPVLRGADGLRQVVQVCNQLNQWGARTNSSCGFHVHIGFDRSNTEALQRLVHMVANHEAGIFAATGTKSREHATWCRSVKHNFRGLNFAQPINTVGGQAQNRYHVLNVSNLVNGTKPTVEFRAFAGTTNASKIITYVRMCLGFAERAITDKRAAKWDAKNPSGKSPMLRKIGPGYTALTRLLYQLGWVKGRTHTVYGEVIDAQLPTIEQSKAELRRLAKKYDAAR